jgi:hypothetical protein
MVLVCGCSLSRGDYTTRRTAEGSATSIAASVGLMVIVGPASVLVTAIMALAELSPTGGPCLPTGVCSMPASDCQRGRLEAGIHVRTTIMLQNMPDRVDFEDLSCLSMLLRRVTTTSCTSVSTLATTSRSWRPFPSQPQTSITNYPQDYSTCVFVSTIIFSMLSSSSDQVPDCCPQDTASRV